MIKGSPEKAKGGFVERTLRWDERFNRRLGIIAVGGAGVASVLGAPLVATVAAGVAAFSFVDAEIAGRFARSAKKH